MTTLKELKEMDAWVEKGDRIDVKTALNSLFRLENDALSSRDGYGYSSGDAEIIRKVIMRYSVLSSTLADLIRVIELAEKSLQRFVNATDSHPPIDLMNEIGRCSIDAKTALSEIRKLKGE